MTGAFNLARKRQLWITLFALPALVFRLAIPAGFMLGVAADDSLSMEFCHGVGPALAQPDDNDSSLPTESSERHASCAFAASALYAPLPHVAALILAGADTRHTQIHPPLSADLDPIFRAHQPRGPPLPG